MGLAHPCGALYSGIIHPLDVEYFIHSFILILQQFYIHLLI